MLPKSRRGARLGPNVLAPTTCRTAFRIFCDVLREPMLALLIGIGIVSLVLGNVEEAILLPVFA
ncbi:MAG: cation-transporting P-type ATPase [Rhodospirillales bacterium]